MSPTAELLVSFASLVQEITQEWPRSKMVGQRCHEHSVLENSCPEKCGQAFPGRDVGAKSEALTLTHFPGRWPEKDA